MSVHTFCTLAFTFPRDVSDNDNDDDDDKAVTINQFCHLKWKDITFDCGRWNSSIGRLKVIGSLSEKIWVSGLNAQKHSNKFSINFFFFKIPRLSWNGIINQCVQFISPTKFTVPVADEKLITSGQNVRGIDEFKIRYNLYLLK